MCYRWEGLREFQHFQNSVKVLRILVKCDLNGVYKFYVINKLMLISFLMFCVLHLCLNSIIEHLINVTCEGRIVMYNYFLLMFIIIFNFHIYMMLLDHIHWNLTLQKIMDILIVTKQNSSLKPQIRQSPL